MIKACSKCQEERSYEDFYKDKRASDGLQSSCKLCASAYNKSAERKAQKNLMYDPEKRKQNHLDNLSRDRERNKRWAEENRERRLSKKREHYSRSRFAYASYVRQRQAQKLLACPSWLTDIQKTEIKNFYWMAKDLELVSGQRYHVDHIIPLKGDSVCGLHVPWNLQVLPADINLSKGNKHGNLA